MFFALLAALLMATSIGLSLVFEEYSRRDWCRVPDGDPVDRNHDPGVSFR